MSLLPFATEPEVLASATISPCGDYRYDLIRQWGPDRLNLVNFLMLNPSTADANLDDPTIRRCVGFAESWGYDAMVVTNLFALRSTDPRKLRDAADPVGPVNDLVILSHAMASLAVVAAWGSWSPGGTKGPRRDLDVLGFLRAKGVAPKAIRLSKDGHPCHPLYLPAHLTPIDFPGA